MNRTECNMILLECIAQLDDYKALLNKLKLSSNIPATVSNLGIGYNVFYKQVFIEKLRLFGKTHRHNLKLQDVCTWQELFYLYIQNPEDQKIGIRKYNRAFIEEIPPNLDANIDYMLDASNGFVNETESAIIKMRFHGGKTYKVIGEELGLSITRIEQIVRKVVYKFKNPKIMRYIELGVSEIESIQTKQKKVLEERRKRYDDLKLAMQVSQSTSEVIEKIFSADSIDKSYQLHVLDGDINLNSLNLSTRLYNTLGRAGFKKLADLDNMTLVNFLKIRNLGVVTLKELLYLIEPYVVIERERE